MLKNNTKKYRNTKKNVCIFLYCFLTYLSSIFLVQNSTCTNSDKISRNFCKIFEKANAKKFQKILQKKIQ